MTDQLFEPEVKFTERDMLTMLLTRYNTERRGTIADRYVRAEHVRSSQGFYGISIADFIAIDKYSASQAVIGHEVKVSRSDWLTELRDLSKAERIKRYCTYWYLVVSDASIVKDGELPEGWGLMVKAGERLRIKHRAPKLTPVPMTLDFVAGLAAAVQRTSFREPLHRPARTIHMWKESIQDSVFVCQACGEPAPCQLHQGATP
ncbi:hypothetical protein [Glutamicibacter ardleyensis]|uniref:hypothetical protein n=1 Tax=Glutamicibacter ardleyensis TaxID=225894 RepID=UPI003FD43BF0